MKVAIASKGYSLDSNVSPLFGKSSTFIIVDVEESKIKATSMINNPAKNETGSGNTAAHFLTNHERL